MQRALKCLCVLPALLTNVILACFVLSAVPLVVALAELAFGLDALAKRSQLSVREAEAASSASRELRDVTGKIERAVRQSIVLEDASLIDGYRKLDAQLASLDSQPEPAAGGRRAPPSNRSARSA